MKLSKLQFWYLGICSQSDIYFSWLAVFDEFMFNVSLKLSWSISIEDENEPLSQRNHDVLALTQSLLVFFQRKAPTMRPCKIRSLGMIFFETTKTVVLI